MVSFLISKFSSILLSGVCDHSACAHWPGVLASGHIGRCGLQLLWEVTANCMLWEVTCPTWPQIAGKQILANFIVLISSRTEVEFDLRTKKIGNYARECTH